MREISIRAPASTVSFGVRPPDGLAGRLATQFLDLGVGGVGVAVEPVADVAIQEIVGALDAALQRQGVGPALLELGPQDAFAGLVALGIVLVAARLDEGRAVGVVAQVLQEHQLQVGAGRKLAVVAGAELAGPVLVGLAAVLAAGTGLVLGVGDVAVVREVLDLAVDPDLAARGRALDRAARRIVLDLVVALEGLADRRAAVGEAGHPRAAVEGLVGAVDVAFSEPSISLIAVPARGLELQQRAEQAVRIEIGLDVGDLLDLHGRLDHHIGQDRLALHVDARGAAADQLDALDGRGRDALEDVLQVLALGGGRSPLISTLPAVPAKPRALSPPSSRKPGRRVIMSRAVLGRCSAKKLGG
jgi:type IV secretory pathway TrbD component